MQTSTTSRRRPLLNTFGAGLLLALCAACGGGGGAGSPPAVTPPVALPALSILAGNPSEAATIDGSGTAARFAGPTTLTIDTSGKLYAGGPCAIRQVTPAGLVSRFAGAYCGSDASGAPDSFPTAFTLASSADGRLFMTTYGLDVFEVSPAGVARKFAVLEPAIGGGGRGASIAYGNGIAVDAAGNVIVTNGFGVRRIAPSGSYTMLGGVAISDPGFGTYVALRRGVVLDAAGTVYLASNDTTIVRIDAAGKTTLLAGAQGLPGTSDGAGASARFTNIVALALDGQGNLYAADSGADGALIRKITPAGVVSTIAGTPGAIVLKTGPLPGSLAPLGGIALDGKGNLYASSGTAIVKIVLP